MSGGGATIYVEGKVKKNEIQAFEKTVKCNIHNRRNTPLILSHGIGVEKRPFITRRTLAWVIKKHAHLT